MHYSLHVESGAREKLGRSGGDPWCYEYEKMDHLDLYPYGQRNNDLEREEKQERQKTVRTLRTEL